MPGPTGSGSGSPPWAAWRVLPVGSHAIAPCPPAPGCLPCTVPSYGPHWVRRVEIMYLTGNPEGRAYVRAHSPASFLFPNQEVVIRTTTSKLAASLVLLFGTTHTCSTIKTNIFTVDWEILARKYIHLDGTMCCSNEENQGCCQLGCGNTNHYFWIGKQNASWAMSSNVSPALWPTDVRSWGGVGGWNCTNCHTWLLAIESLTPLFVT